MIRKSILFTAVFCAALALPVPMAARATMHWYQPHYLPSVEEASNRLQFLSPHFAPVTAIDENLTTGYSLQRVDVNKLGVNLSFTKSGVNTTSQYYWSWWGGYVAPTSTSYVDDITASVVYADVSYFEIYNNERAVGYPATWCVDYIHRTPGGNSTICVPSQADAHSLIDALATLVVASGQSLEVSPGIFMKAPSGKDIQKHPERAGLQITRMDADGPPALAGMKEGDTIRSINGKPCFEEKDFWDVFSRAIREKPEGADIRIELLRKNNPMAFNLHYPNPDAGVAQLRVASAAGSARHPVGSVISIPGATPAAPPSGVRFGFNVRPVAQDDMTSLALTKAQGLVVVSVENGSLASATGILAGDVILQVNGADVGSMQQFVQIIRGGAAASFRVWRKGKALELTVPQSL